METTNLLSSFTFMKRINNESNNNESVNTENNNELNNKDEIDIV